MKYFWLVLLIAIIFTAVNKTHSALFLINTLASFGSFTSHRDINYGIKAEQKLDIYLPNNISSLSIKTIPTVIFFYGGCWGACSKLDKSDYKFIAQTLTSQNMITVIVDYQKFPSVKFNDIVKDAAKSVEWVNSNIASYKGNPNNIFLMGHSAGAHLASMLTFNKKYLTKDTYKNIRGFIGIAGPYDFLPFDEPYQPALFSPPESYPNSQTINFVEGNEPPSLLLYGNNDTRVKRRNILSLSKIIKDKKGKVQTHFYDDTNHTSILSALSIPLRTFKPILNDIQIFIQNSL